MERIALGDESALGQLHGLIASRLYLIARQILSSHECAQEIVGDVFVHVWQNARSYDMRRGPVEAWLHVATRNRSIDRLRSYRRHTLLSGRLCDEGESHAADPDAALTQLQVGQSIDAALSLLSPLRRQLLALAFFDGLTHEEISERVGMPLGTVKSHLRRALFAMRAPLAGCSRSLSGALDSLMTPWIDVVPRR